MRRLALLLGGCALFLSACGGSSSPQSKPPPPVPRSKARLTIAGLQPPSGCYVTVYLVEAATRAQIESVQRRLLAQRGVARVSFVPRGLALERFVKKDPKVAKGMHVNPFSDQFEVVPRTFNAIFAIIGDFAMHGGPITNALPGGTCANRRR